MDEFLADLIPNLIDRTPEHVADVAVTAISVVAFQTNSTPRAILDNLWKAMDDDRYERQMRPALAAVAHPTV